jgi:hypothetical protein
MLLVSRDYLCVKPALSTINRRVTRPLTPDSPTLKRPIKPESLVLKRGALGSGIDGRSVEGKFIRRIEAELLEALGDNPTFSQLLLVRRAARAALKLELYDRKLADGDVNSHDSRMYGGLSNNLRLLLRELNAAAVTKGKAKTPDLSVIVSRHKAASP